MLIRSVITVAIITIIAACSQQEEAKTVMGHSEESLPSRTAVPESVNYVPLNEKELAWLAEREADAETLADVYLEPEESELTVEALDELVAAYVAAPDKTDFSVDAVSMALGAAFGNQLVEGLGMKWTLLNNGTVVVHPQKDLLGAPLEFAAAKVQGNSPNFGFADAYNETKATLESRAPKAVAADEGTS